jgi:nitrogen fixation protein FixH
MKAFTTGPFTGRHAAMMIVAFFAVVVAVNLVMARAASATFGGVVVKNSYVASQHYNRWLDEAAREKALGWTLEARRDADNRLDVTLAGAPGDAALAAQARHPLGRQPGFALAFAAQGGGRFVSREVLPPGRWTVRFEASSAGKRFRHEQDIR